MNRIWRCLYVCFHLDIISTCLLKNPGGVQLNSLFFWLVINIGLIKIQIRPKVSLRCDQFSRENKDLHISESLSSVSEGSCKPLSGYTYFKNYFSGHMTPNLQLPKSFHYLDFQGAEPEVADSFQYHSFIGIPQHALYSWSVFWFKCINKTIHRLRQLFSGKDWNLPPPPSFLPT